MPAGVVITSQTIMFRVLPLAATTAYPTIAVPGSIPSVTRIPPGLCPGEPALLCMPAFLYHGKTYRDVLPFPEVRCACDACSEPRVKSKIILRLRSLLV